MSTDFIEPFNITNSLNIYLMFIESNHDYVLSLKNLISQFANTMQVFTFYWQSASFLVMILKSMQQSNPL